MAALLHDIGHYPLSHVGEAVFMRIQFEKEQVVKKKAPDLEESALTRAGKKYRGKVAHHERLGVAVITGRDEILLRRAIHKFVLPDEEEMGGRGGHLRYSKHRIC